MTFWMVRDSGMDERISRDWMLLMILFLMRYFIALVPEAEAEVTSDTVISDNMR